MSSGGGAALPAGHRLGRYEILGKLAAGGMAIVYVARAHGAGGFERMVALKVLHANLAYEEEFIKMFLDEARLAARIRHPNVVPTIDISDTAQTGFFLVMDYIEGDHLGALLSGAHRASTRLPVQVVLRILVDALGGLGAAHALCDESGRCLNLVHRDVSPHNIMVGLDGVARLTDFGVAKAEDRLTHTRDGQVKGKLAYMAPEQASTGTSDSRSDLFSAGIILWECLTGRRLFRGESTAATLHKLLAGEIAPPSMVDPALAPLDPVLARALARDPDQRYATAAEFADALESVAPAAGGLASSRSVSKAVARFAETRIQRDRKLIEEAKGRLARRGPFELDAISEPSATDLSFSSNSLSFSKLSGVYSSGSATAVNSVAPVVAPPPALGTFDPSVVPPAPAARPPTVEPGRRLLWIMLSLIAVLTAYLLLSEGDQPNPVAVPVESAPAEPAPSEDVAEATPAAPEPAHVTPSEPGLGAAPVSVEQPGVETSQPQTPAAAVTVQKTERAVPKVEEKKVARSVEPSARSATTSAAKVRTKRETASKPAPPEEVELLNNPYRSR